MHIHGGEKKILRAVVPAPLWGCRLDERSSQLAAAQIVCSEDERQAATP